MSVRAVEAEVSIKSGVSAECTIGREVIVEVHDDVALDSLTVTQNGSYTPTEGVDGFSDVSVNVPSGPKASGSFSVTTTGTTKTIDTGRADWTHMLIVPHVFPYVGITQSGLVRAIMSKHVDLENNIMVTAFASSSGASFTSSAARQITEGGDCEVTDGVVKLSGEGSLVGRWIKDCQYDWWAW